MATDIDITIEDLEEHPDAKIIIFIGALDATNIEGVSKQINALIDTGHSKLIADFNKLRYLNSTALGNIIDYNKIAKRKNGAFVLANVNDSVYEIFDIVGATTILDFYDTIEEAIANL